MRNLNIIIDDGFWKEAARLHPNVRRKFQKTFFLFTENSHHPSLRLHPLQGDLSGRWSISIDRKYRIILRFLENGDALFTSVGTHAIYT